MLEILSFLIGSIITLLILMFIGWVDVAFMNKPITKIRADKPILTYMFVSAWEGLFFISGLLVGYYVL